MAKKLTKPTPTSAIPGSSRKVEVLATRYALGQELWHPLDAQLPLGEERGIEPNIKPGKPAGVAADPCRSYKKWLNALDLTVNENL